jgi:delta8-fatty-acid desaturase
LLIVIDDGVYDLTSFAAYHPGGALALQHAAGQQVSDLFAEYHPASTYNLLPALQCGMLAPSCRPHISALAQDRRELRQQLLREGLFESRPYYFVWVLVRAFAFLGAAVYLLVTGMRPELAAYATYMRFVAAVCLGLFFQQMAFIGHDSGHSGVSHDRYFDSVLGLFTGNLFSGISMAWWKYSHNVHHIVCNSVEHDPDIQHLPFFAISSAILVQPTSSAAAEPFDAPMSSKVLANGASIVAELRRREKTAGPAEAPILPALIPPAPPATVEKPTSGTLDPSRPAWWNWSPLYYSTIHRKWVGHDWLTRCTLSIQHWVYYPLMAVARFNLYAQSWLLLITNKGRPQWRAAEMAMLFLHVCWHVSLVYFTLPDAWSRFAFVVGSHAVAGILHVQITLSHFAMQVYHGHRLNKFEDWCTTQLMTTMNIQSDWRTDWFYGGLQFQIEHHLFPRVPRHHLRRVSELVRPFCQKHGLPYVSVAFFEANRLVIGALRQAAQVAWSAPSADFGGSMLSDGLHARG